MVILMVIDIHFAFKAVIAFKAEEPLSIREYFIHGVLHVISSFLVVGGVATALWWLSVFDSLGGILEVVNSILHIGHIVTFVV
jgi:hypothetical protein